jgi:hypothetical protein
MKLLNSNYSIEAGNYNKPTPKKLKLLADILLFIIMVIDFATPWLHEMPEIKEKLWIIWIVSGVGVLFKFITKYISEHPAPEPTTDVS